MRRDGVCFFHNVVVQKTWPFVWPQFRQFGAQNLFRWIMVLRPWRADIVIPHLSLTSTLSGPALASFLGVPPITAVAMKTVYVSRRKLADAS
jgi:hypothetical protein